MDIRPFIKDLVFGLEDGLITPLGVVLGVATSGVSPSIVILAGLAATFSNAVSMAAGDYLSTEYMLEAYRARRVGRRAGRASAVMFISTLAGVLVVAPFFFSRHPAATWSSLLIAVVGLFITGAAITRWTKRSWLKHGIEMVIVGLAAGFIGFLIGRIVGVPVV